MRRAFRRRERLIEEELEDRLAREVELAAEERRIEGRVETRVRRRGDRRGRVRRALEPPTALRRRLREARREIAFAEILDELVPGAVVGDEAGKPDPAGERRVRRDPAPPRIRLIRRIDDADERTVVGEVDPEVPPPPDVADERLDRGRNAELPASERFQSGGVGRKQRR